MRTVELDPHRSPTLVADVYAPGSGGASKRTAILFLHGGAWRVGSRSMMRIRAEELSGHGFVCIAAQYRLLGEAPWPAQLDDCRSWIRWIRRHASELEVEADRIAVLGCSAGGHLALLAAALGSPEDDSWVDAVIAMYPPTELAGGTAAMLLGEAASAEDARSVSPLHQVSAGFPPTMLVHGLADDRVPPEMSQAMHEELLACGVPSELHLFDGQVHEFDAAPSYAAVVQHLAAVFLDRRLVDPERFDAEQTSHNPILGPPSSDGR